MSLGAYTPEQWAVIQQKICQQWSEYWQQRAQCQSQYGDKVQSSNNSENEPGKSLNKSYPPDTANNNMQCSSTEGIRKLLEEERLFDIYFKKWEEEIENYKKQNVNHPNKQAYNEYTQMVELRRTELLELRQKIKQKRAKLLSSNPYLAVNVLGKKPLSMSPQSCGNIQSNNTLLNMQSQNYSNLYSIPSDKLKNIEKNKLNQDINDFNSSNDYPRFLPNRQTLKKNPELNLASESDNHLSISKSHTMIDILNQNTKPTFTQGPDYSAISEVKNNSLGDEKIMKTLPMIQGQKPLYGNSNQNIAPYLNIIINYQMTNNENGMANTKKISYNQQAPNDYQSTQQNASLVPKNNAECFGETYREDNLLVSCKTPARNVSRINIKKGSFPLLNPVPGECINDYGDSPMYNDQLKKELLSKIPNFTPTTMIEYNHKPFRLKDHQLIKSVYTFDFNRNKKEHFKKEIHEVFSRKPCELKKENKLFMSERYNRDYCGRGFESRSNDTPNPLYERRPKKTLQEDLIQVEYESKRKHDTYLIDRCRIDERDELNNSRKRKLSESSEDSDCSSNKQENTIMPVSGKNGTVPEYVVKVDDLLEPPGRDTRGEKILIILRGIPGSGKSYLAKLISDREAKYGCTVRIMSIDDCFMREEIVEAEDPSTGEMVKKCCRKYEYDASSERTYITILQRSLKKSLTNGYYSFFIYDAVNSQQKDYKHIMTHARQSGFQVYVCTMQQDPSTCYKRNIHNRNYEDILKIHSEFIPTHSHEIKLDVTTLLSRIKNE